MKFLKYILLTIALIGLVACGGESSNNSSNKAPIVNAGKDVTDANTSCIKDMSKLFYNSTFNQDISSWNVSNVTSMKALFFNSEFNQNISSWNISNVTNMNDMFSYSIFN